jgi:hypothetical protein
MAERSAPNCKCAQKRAEAMKKGHHQGLDELMIVNPGRPGGEAFFLGEDGTLYQVQGLGEEAELQGTGELFLGEEGALYEVQGFGSGSTTEPGDGLGASLEEDDGQELGRYFLGDDGTLYKVVDR